ncbi:hypothetical protein XBFFL1_690001 [Xenorhabdus bovienii str. feltiae Florida]|uniref:Uncharacterized protein n=2 Tax=Xenorhabdus bovienii TaxID=40576 RepID=A0A0B6XFN2_XENBV|nr:hypothetical protein XBFFR1_770001 [Xenorhabdus bovienii str. feltiae France]CDG94487.1 hypothetical protein XBFFL1_690001 [Xenorhabdus bovienii str. feltiae Florida]CDH00300.1 hypothetical protein XBFM1_1500001 [Xenorhabdus bovienii str. feltiae Moldova]CDM91214.1 protein of unknown function [Xenorhabdus bovienii]
MEITAMQIKFIPLGNHVFLLRIYELKINDKNITDKESEFLSSCLIHLN